MLQDVRYAIRQLLQHKGFSAVVIITFALGIGANTAVFSVVRSVLFTPLPYGDPSRLVAIWEHNLPQNHPHNVVNPQNYLDWAQRSRSFTAMGAYGWANMTLAEPGQPAENVAGAAVTPDLFQVLGVSPALGRGFTAAEGLPNGPPVVVLSNELWRSRYGGDPAIIGRQLHLAGGKAVTAVGVMPAGFRPLLNERYWEPFRLDPSDRQRTGRYAMVVARLKPGATVAGAQADMAAVSAGLSHEDPDFDAGWTTDVAPLQADIVGGSRLLLWLLMGAAGMVLLITCANIGNLMLARAAARQRDLAVRAALGAARWRLARQWLIDNLVLAAIGGAVGVLIANWGVTALVRLAPDGVPRLHEIRVDRVALLVTVAISLLAGIAAGLPAAFDEWRRSGVGELSRGHSRVTAGERVVGYRAALVVFQVALALALVLGAGLLLRSVGRLLAVSPGFEPDHVVTTTVSLPVGTYPDDASQRRFFDRLDQRFRALPGVQSVGAVTFVPLTGVQAATDYRIVGKPAPAPGQSPTAVIRIIEPGYFPTMRIPVLRGRDLNDADRADAAPVVVVSRSLAERDWPGQNPIGQRLLVGWYGADTAREVVGVVGDVRHSGLADPVDPTIYYPEAQEPYNQLSLVVRPIGPPRQLPTEIRRAIIGLDPQIPVGAITTMQSVMTQSVNDRRYPMLLLGVFAALAVTLAGVGVYGVLAFAVRQRSREIGIRMALGAAPASVTRMIVMSGMRLTAAGLVIGAVAGVAAARLLGTLLFDTSRTDPLTLAGAAGVFAAVALVAVAIPALRAARVDPIITMRAE